MKCFICNLALLIPTWICKYSLGAEDECYGDTCAHTLVKDHPYRRSGSVKTLSFRCLVPLVVPIRGIPWHANGSVCRNSSRSGRQRESEAKIAYSHGTATKTEVLKLRQPHMRKENWFRWGNFAYCGRDWKALESTTAINVIYTYIVKSWHCGFKCKHTFQKRA